MKTISIDQGEMARRISRYQDLSPLAGQRSSAIPQSAADVVWARNPHSVIGLDAGLETPINQDRPADRRDAGRIGPRPLHVAPLTGVIRT